MHSDVIVVGSGPTGLLLAGDVADAGMTVTVLERRTTESNLTRAFAVHARTLELLDQRGLADELLAAGSRIGELTVFEAIRLRLTSLPTRYPFLLIAPQYATEDVLRARAERLGVRFVNGADVVGVEQDADGVVARTRDGARYAARYLVGADGVRSTVRREIGLPFPGRQVLRSIMLADVKLRRQPDDALMVNSTGAGFAMIAPFGDGYHRVFAWEHGAVPPEHPLEFEEVRAVVERVFGTDLGMHDPRWLSRFRSDERQAPRYRVGRVFLAGDAAHVHSPAGGQGMNVGLQDAANLGWKLAAVLQGRAGAALLDSYDDERHPVGRAVLRSSGALIRMAMVRSPLARAVRNGVMRLALAVPGFADRVAGTVSGIGVRYPAPAGAPRAAGRRVPDLELAEGRLFAALRGGRFVLVTDEPRPAVPEWIDVVRPARPVAAPLLVRPDGYLAWAGDPADYPARL